MKNRLLRLGVLFLALLLSGCYTTVSIGEGEEVSQQVTNLPIRMENDTNEDLRALYYAVLALQNAQSDVVFSAEETAMLDAFCRSQPGQFSVYCKDLYTGESYLYGGTALYYPASMLKAPYALWLCQQADEGLLELEKPLPNRFLGREQGTALEDFNGQETIPARDLLCAMIAQSDNNATEILSEVWPGTGDFQSWLGALGFSAPDTCSILPGKGIEGMCTVTDMAAVWNALYAYFESGAPHAAFLQGCFFDADHPGLSWPEYAPAARKYGSWDGAFHDAALVYAVRPYILVCMTNQGSESVDFPQEPVTAMEQLGGMIEEVLTNK